MQGKTNDSSGLFYYFQPENVIPENHLLKLLNKYIDFSFIRQKVKHLYSRTGRPSIAPEVMIKMLLIGYFFDITSERKLCDEVSMHIGYRWFCGLSMDEKVPDHSTFSKNRHGRFKQSGIFQDIFDEIVNQCIALGMVSGEHITVDGSFVKANASIKNMVPIPVQFDSKKYMKEVEKKNPVKSEEDNTPEPEEDNTPDPEENSIEESKKPWEPNGDYNQKTGKKTNKTHISPSDPDSKIGKKRKTPTNLYHCINYLMDNDNQIVIGVKGDTPDIGGEQRAATRMLEEIYWKFHFKPKSLGADKGYGTATFLHSVFELGIIPHIPIIERKPWTTKNIYSIDMFEYDLKTNEHICPQGKRMKSYGYCKSKNQYRWRAKETDCRMCPCKEKCTTSSKRSITKHAYYEYVKKAKKFNNTKKYIKSQIKRKWIEGLFGEGKEFMGLRTAKFRCSWNVNEQFLMTATVQNMKRMIKISVKKDRDDAKMRKLSPFSAIFNPFIIFFKNTYFWLRYDLTRSSPIQLQGT